MSINHCRFTTLRIQIKRRLILFADKRTVYSKSTKVRMNERRETCGGSTSFHCKWVKCVRTHVTERKIQKKKNIIKQLQNDKQISSWNCDGVKCTRTTDKEPNGWTAWLTLVYMSTHFEIEMKTDFCQYICFRMINASVITTNSFVFVTIFRWSSRKHQRLVSVTWTRKNIWYRLTWL